MRKCTVVSLNELIIAGHFSHGAKLFLTRGNYNEVSNFHIISELIYRLNIYIMTSRFRIYFPPTFYDFFIIFIIRSGPVHISTPVQKNITIIDALSEYLFSFAPNIRIAKAHLEDLTFAQIERLISWFRRLASPFRDALECPVGRFQAESYVWVPIVCDRAGVGAQTFDELLVAVGLMEGDELHPAFLEELIVAAANVLFGPIRLPVAYLDATSGGGIGLPGARRAVEDSVEGQFIRVQSIRQ